MARTRSPGYPLIGLKEALEKVSLVYMKDYQNKVPRTIIAEHMGYKTLNGKSLGVLSAVAKYGLIEGRADANWVSDLALSIIAHESGSQERIRAISDAASRPELFAELDAKFPSGASDSAMRSYLLTQKFIPQAAEVAIRSYRDTKQLVSEESQGYDPLEYEKATAHEAPELADQAIVSKAVVREAPGRLERIEGEKEFLRHNLAQDCEVRVLVKGKITARELRKLRQLIYMSELWAAETPADRPPGADEVEAKLEEASTQI